MKPLDIIKKYYPESSDAYRILVTHSRSVADSIGPFASGDESGSDFY